MGEEGEYVTMVGFLTSASQNEWADAAVARQREKYPEMTLIEVERVETEDSMEIAYEKAKELLKTYPNLKGFLGTSSYDAPDRKSTRLNSSHARISYAVFCLKKKTG